MKIIKYIFFYYWSTDRRPLPGKGVREDGTMVGYDNAIKGAEWEITEEEFCYTSLHNLTNKHPWPFGGEDETV